MPTPDTQNLLSQNGFRLIIDRLPNVVYFTQQVKLPTVSLPEAPTHDSPFAVHPKPGDRIKWEVFELTYKVNEDLSNYTELFNWITALGHPVNMAALKAMAPTGKHKDMVSDAVLQILTSHKNVQQAVRFVDLFPISLTGLDLTATEADITYLNVTAQFGYQRFEFI